MTSVQAIYVPADGLTDPCSGGSVYAPGCVYDAVAHRRKGIYPAVDRLNPTAASWISTILGRSTTAWR